MPKTELNLTTKARDYTDYMKYHLGFGGTEAALKWLAGHIGLLTARAEKLGLEIKRMKRAKRSKTQ